MRLQLAVAVAVVVHHSARAQQPTVSDGTQPKQFSATCQDTPGWSNGWSGCAWLDHGKDPALCRPTPNATWPSTSGWTCEYYRQQGLCGKRNGAVKEIRESARGLLHNWPEKNCCGCEEQDDTTCNRQTGKTCAFNLCGSSQGPAYCHNLSSCLCLPGHCASTDGICSLEVTVTPATHAAKTAAPTAATPAVQAKVEQVCQDTPDWSNGWSGCAYEEGGKNPDWCRILPGTSWPSTSGWTCEYYRMKGICKNGDVPDWAAGPLRNYPEYNCCGCRQQVDTTCNRNTGGHCRFGLCDQSRGPTVCVNGECLCQPGHCGTTTGVCSLTVAQAEAMSSQEVMKQATGAGESAAEAARMAGKSAEGEVIAAATAAGDSALRNGATLEQAAQAAAIAAGKAAATAHATPAQAGRGVAEWVQKQYAAKGTTGGDEVLVAAKAAATAAKEAGEGAFLRKEQVDYAMQEAAARAAMAQGMDLQQALEVAGKATGTGGEEGDMLARQSREAPAVSQGSESHGWVVWLVVLVCLLLAGAGIYYAKKKMSQRRGIYGGYADEESKAFTEDSSDE